MMIRSLKGLQDAVSMSATANYFDPAGRPGTDTYAGWAFDVASPDPVAGFKNTFEVYRSNHPDYPNKQLSVPILFDKKTMRVVSNDNMQLQYIFNSGFNSLLSGDLLALDMAPERYEQEMDKLNTLIYPNINDGVYRCAFSSTPEVKAEMKANLFKALDEVEAILQASRSKNEGEFYLVQENVGLTLADIRAFPHLFRFDTCYYTAFGCDLRTLAGSYPAIMAWLEQLYAKKEIQETCDLWKATLGYHKSDEAKARAAYETYKAPFVVR